MNVCTLSEFARRVTVAVMLFPAAAQAQQVFDEVKSVGNAALEIMVWLGGLGAIFGFFKAAQSFNEGNPDEGWQRLKASVIGCALVFGSVSIVQLVGSKFGVQAYR